jgi:hypothetical protein
MKRKIFIILCGFVVVTLLVMIFITFGGIPVGGVVQEKPETLAERTDAQGNIIGRIVRDTTFTSRYYWISAVGDRTERHYSYRYFLEQPGKERLELTFLRDELGQDVELEKCRAVQGSNLWIIPAHLKDVKFTLFVFDSTHILQKRTLSAIADPTRPEAGVDYRLENGNRIFIFRTKQGFSAYDVLTDKISDWKNGN